MPYTVSSLFAGIGGIDKGFEQAGANIIWANEMDKNACITYRANFEHELKEEDIVMFTQMKGRIQILLLLVGHVLRSLLQVIDTV
ncbi:DNA cytosine methyltransferase [Niallia circulans]